MCGLWIIVWKRSPIKDPLGIIRMSDFKSQKKHHHQNTPQAALSSYSIPAPPWQQGINQAHTPLGHCPRSFFSRRFGSVARGVPFSKRSFELQRKAGIELRIRRVGCKRRGFHTATSSGRAGNIWLDEPPLCWLFQKSFTSSFYKDRFIRGSWEGCRIKIMVTAFVTLGLSKLSTEGQRAQYLKPKASFPADTRGHFSSLKALVMQSTVMMKPRNDRWFRDEKEAKT